MSETLELGAVLVGSGLTVLAVLGVAMRARTTTLRRLVIPQNLRRPAAILGVFATIATLCLMAGVLPAAVPAWAFASGFLVLMFGLAGLSTSTVHESSKAAAQAEPSDLRAAA